MGQYFSTFISSLNENLRNRLFYALDTIETVFVRSLTFETKDEQVLHPISLERSLSFKAWECEDSDSTTEKLDLFYDCRENLSSICLNGTIPRPTIVIPDASSILVANEMNAAATKVQKVYKSYRTRRNLADCAVIVEELWWQALDFAALRRSSVSFFNAENHESANSRWGRARTRAAKVGKGSSKDEKSQKLALQHWLEAIDPRHRYGHNLHFYYDVWFDSKSTQPFFYWLDVGDGKEVYIEKCPRADLQCQCIKYLGPKEREAYEVIVESGKLVYRQNRTLVNTIEGSKWIFVLSTSRALYVGNKKKGKFQHSSFLSGGATTAAGRLVAYEGVLQAIWPYSGHYLPTEENFKEFINFLQDNHVNLTDVKKYATDNDQPSSSVISGESNESSQENSIKEEESLTNATNNEELTAKISLAKALSCKWTSGAGPRIGCVRDYPINLQTKALEQVNLSPKSTPDVITKRLPIPSPRPSPQIHLSPRLTCIYGTS